LPYSSSSSSSSSSSEESNADKVRALIGARHAVLSDADYQRVAGILNGPTNQEVLIFKFNIPMTREKLLCLRPRGWLNDEVVNFCMDMLQERDDSLCELNPTRKQSHYFNSFFIDKLLGNDHLGYFYQDQDVYRWARNIRLFELDKVFIPVNIPLVHWTMAVVVISKKEIHYYDSMKGKGIPFLNGLLHWVADEAAARGVDFDRSQWKLYSPPCPQQRNGFDCGMFSIMCADVMTDDIPVSEEAYAQQHMAFFRLKVASAVLRGCYDYPLEGI
jgi:sentrin-specific protease 1